MSYRLLALLIAFASTLAASAQDRAIYNAGVAGGAGVSSGTRFAVTGSVGLPDATLVKLSGPRFGVNGGFHAIVAAIQTPGAPELTVSVAGGGVTVSWDTTVAGWTLQQSDALGPSANWSDSADVADNRVSIAMPSGHRFYRLRRANQP